MKELLSTIDAWGEAAATAGRAVVVRTFGSAPRPEGAVLLVDRRRPDRGLGQRRLRRGRGRGGDRASAADGALPRDSLRDQRRGGVGRRARLRRHDRRPRRSRRSPTAALEAARVSSRVGGHGAAVITPLPADSPPAEFGEHPPGDGAPPEPALTLDDDGLHGTLGDAALDDELANAARDALRRGQSRTVELGGRSLFVEAFPVRPRLVDRRRDGDGPRAREHRGHARLRADRRSTRGRRSRRQERFPDVDRLINDWPDEAFDAIDLGPNDAVAVLSHDAKFDEPAIAEALRRGVRYVGAVGSRKTQADRRARLREAGVDEADLARLHGPIGLDLGGRAPAETALAIMAEIVADRYGGSGRPMIDAAAGPRGVGWTARPTRPRARPPRGSRMRRRDRRWRPGPARGSAARSSRLGSRASRSSQHVLDALATAGSMTRSSSRPAPTRSAGIDWGAARTGHEPGARTRPRELAPDRLGRGDGAASPSRRMPCSWCWATSRWSVRTSSRRSSPRRSTRRGRSSRRATRAPTRRNPVRLERDAAPLVDEAARRSRTRSADRRRSGARPLARMSTATTRRRHAADLARAAEPPGRTASVATASQVDRFREEPDGKDFYASVSSIFRDDPDRPGRSRARCPPRARAGRADTWLDIGAGAGRYALPLARVVRRGHRARPVAGRCSTPSRAQMARARHRERRRRSQGRWPPTALADDGRSRTCRPSTSRSSPTSGTTSRRSGRSSTAMERAARRRVPRGADGAQPGAVAEPFWPPLHGEPRVALPALPAFVDLLARARPRARRSRCSSRAAAAGDRATRSRPTSGARPGSRRARRRTAGCRS